MQKDRRLSSVPFSQGIILQQYDQLCTVMTGGMTKNKCGLVHTFPLWLCCSKEIFKIPLTYAWVGIEACILVLEVSDLDAFVVGEKQELANCSWRLITEVAMTCNSNCRFKRTGYRFPSFKKETRAKDSHKRIDLSKQHRGGLELNPKAKPWCLSHGLECPA